jgi:hypothetical protein
MIRPVQKTVVTLFVAAMFSPAQALMVGVADTSNSIPFGSTTGGFFYQQIYSSVSFSSPININGITFYNSVMPGGAPMTGTFHLYLSLTNAPIGNFDTSPFSFPDSSFVNVFHGSLPAVSNGRLDFNLSLSSFLYDPSQGNLLLTVRSFDAAAVGTDSSKWLFLDADMNVGVTNGRFSAFSFDWNQGLVTGFNDAAPVPGPIAGAGLPAAVLAGSGLLALARRRKASDEHA